MEARRVPWLVLRTGGNAIATDVRLRVRYNLAHDIPQRRQNELDQRRAHSRSLFKSIMMPELTSALRNWMETGGSGVLIGAAALSFHVRPRMTQDVDFLLFDCAAIPDAVSGFSRISPMLLRHDGTGVEVNVVTQAAIHVPLARTAIMSDGVRVASES